MVKQLLPILIFFCCVAFKSTSIAQQFDYSFSQRIEPYQNLEQVIPLSNQNFWLSEAWGIPIGFNFKFFDYPFDSVTVYCASSLYFGFAEHDDALLFAGFSQAIVDRGWDLAGFSISPISYNLSGVSPDRTCKIEFKNVGFVSAPIEDSVNIQIWLFESDNAIEVHLGPHYVSGPASYESIDASGPTIGFLNSLDDKYALIYNTVQSPSFGYPPVSFTGLQGDWQDGQVYRFAPQMVAAKEPKAIGFKMINMEGRKSLLLQNLETSKRYQICDSVGRIRLEGDIDNMMESVLISYASLNTGWYFLRIIGENRQVTTKPFIATGR